MDTKTRTTLEWPAPDSKPTIGSNSFVEYLNSLHCRSAGNANALAESQARNETFGHIHVPHPILARAREHLLGPTHCHIILTGHAGDGKSTIAVQLFKDLAGLPTHEPLTKDLPPRADIILAHGQAVSIIKDLSEWTQKDRTDIIREMRESPDTRFLLVSNTGTLIQAFRDVELALGGDPLKLESELLEVLSAAAPTDWEHGRTHYRIVNLSMMDNLRIALQVFDRMLEPARWAACDNVSCRNSCPIYHNVRVLQCNKPVILQRLHLAYRRMYEYGTRLTLRQLTGHLAYMITSGLGHDELDALIHTSSDLQRPRFMFFNRFFGDDGETLDTAAGQLRAIRGVREEDFGTRLAPTWERQIWMQGRDPVFSLRAHGVEADFDFLRREGRTSATTNQAARARRQVRRMLFFLHEFTQDDDATSFLSAFLNSLMAVTFNSWQLESNSRLSLTDTRELHKRVLHVLQEHFTSVRLPEGANGERHLFITLSRRSSDVRQSAQVVLARIPEDDLRIQLLECDDGVGGKRRELRLVACHAEISAQLLLGLPFLDYVMMRNQGEVGQDLQTSYVDRLERFKGQLLRRRKPTATDEIMLVRLKTNHTFRRQVFSVREGYVEVTDG